MKSLEYPKEQRLAFTKYAELAWASYFYFDFLKDSNNIPRKIYELNKQGQKIKDENSPRGY